MTALGALLGGLLAAGVILAVSGLVPAEVATRTARRPGGGHVSARRLVLAVAGAVIVGVVTEWPVGVVAGALAGWYLPNMAGGTRRSRRADTDRLRALAAWANQLRDGFAGVGMLQSTICDSEQTAPRAIRPEVQRLAQRMRSPRAGSAERALRLFAGEMADSTADMIVTALLLATSGSAGSLPEILSALAEQADREVAARLEVESHRAEVLMARRIILITVGTFTAYTLLFRRAYLQPFSTPVGQVAAAAVIALFAGSVWYMDRLARLQPALRTMRPEEALVDTPSGVWP
jgi:tight adherence protein B